MNSNLWTPRVVYFLLLYCFASIPVMASKEDRFRKSGEPGS